MCQCIRIYYMLRAGYSTDDECDIRVHKNKNSFTPSRYILRDFYTDIIPTYRRGPC